MPTQDESTTQEVSAEQRARDDRVFNKVMADLDKRHHPEQWDGDQKILDFKSENDGMGLEPPTGHRRVV